MAAHGGWNCARVMTEKIGNDGIMARWRQFIIQVGFRGTKSEWKKGNGNDRNFLLRRPPQSNDENGIEEKTKEFF